MGKPLSEEINDQSKRGVLLVLTGPTGAGKDTVFAKLLAYDPTLIKIITTTSRSMRNSESDGNPYYFISPEKFEQLIGEGVFFEWVEFRGAFYGTQRMTLDEALSKNSDVIWHIDAKGVKNIKDKVKEIAPRSVFVFITAPDVVTLEKRVRKDEGEGNITHRWVPSIVTWEMEQYDDCEYLVVNADDDLEKTVEKIKAIMDAKRMEILP